MFPQLLCFTSLLYVLRAKCVGGEEKIGSKAYFDYIPKYNLYREGEPDKNLMSSIQLALLEDDAETPEEFIEHKIVRRRVIK